MKERRKYARRMLSDRRWGGERRRRERRVAQADAEQVSIERHLNGEPERRVSVRRSGIERRVIRGRVLHDRRGQSGQHPVVKNGIRAKLDDNPRKVRPVLTASRDRKRPSDRRRKRLLLTGFGLAVVIIVILVVVRLV